MQSFELANSWTEAGTGVEAVEPILRFMEEHPDIDYGMPGSLVHFVEHFYKNGYETKLRNIGHTLIGTWDGRRLIRSVIRGLFGAEFQMTAPSDAEGRMMSIVLRTAPLPVAVKDVEYAARGG